MRQSSLITLLSLAPAATFGATLRRRDLTPASGLSGGWTYTGCYVDTVGARALNGSSNSGDKQSAEACTAFCGSNGYDVAGTEYSTECFCGKSVTSQPADDSTTCNMACSGNATQTCGGSDRLSVYTRPATNGPQTNPGPAGYQSLGCYNDTVSARTLSTFAASGDQMTVAFCAATCAGSAYFGVEYASECFCGNTIDNGAISVDNGCTTPCSGNSSEYCGGNDRINLYQAVQTVTSTLTSTQVSTVAPTSSAVASAQPSSEGAPTPSAAPVQSSPAASSAIASPSEASSSVAAPTPSAAPAQSSPAASSAVAPPAASSAAPSSSAAPTPSAAPAPSSSAASSAIAPSASSAIASPAASSAAAVSSSKAAASTPVSSKVASSTPVPSSKAASSTPASSSEAASSTPVVSSKAASATPIPSKAASSTLAISSVALTSVALPACTTTIQTGGQISNGGFESTSTWTRSQSNAVTSELFGFAYEGCRSELFHPTSSFALISSASIKSDVTITPNTMHTVTFYVGRRSSAIAINAAITLTLTPAFGTPVVQMFDACTGLTCNLQGTGGTVWRKYTTQIAFLGLSKSSLQFTTSWAALARTDGTDDVLIDGIYVS